MFSWRKLGVLTFGEYVDYSFTSSLLLWKSSIDLVIICFMVHETMN